MPTGEIEVVVDEVLDVFAPKRKLDEVDMCQQIKHNIISKLGKG